MAAEKLKLKELYFFILCWFFLLLICETCYYLQEQITMQRKEWYRYKGSLSISLLFLWPSLSTHVLAPPHSGTSIHQIRSVAQSCPTLCDPMNRSTPGLPIHHQLPEFTQTHVHWFSDAIQPSHPLSSPSPPAPNPSQRQSLFQWVNSLQEVAKVLEFQL